MIILPAIDIKDGKCVRLVKGDYATAHQVAESPYDTAAAFRAAGAAWIHMVDLDGAKEGKPVNTEIFERVAKESGLKVEVGGGIRHMKTIEQFLEKGISRVILGSVAVKNPDLVKEAVKEFGEKIAVGIDAKNGMVATEGWLEKSDVTYTDLALAMEDAGVRTIIYTDISRDGTLTGVNTEQLGNLNRTVSCNIIASGGVSSIVDIENCIDLNLYGCICGKAVYTGALNLMEAIGKAGEQIC
ncbi:MAG: 1-(5-phosphoribosyl)-5-[(5-phosphoribosylamino)methylideneamino]imidazole-4-carboxamide isomerase [Blautia sp.]|nr:1-(5-phosphoribosyl)-5-[(5-phosphoribosylamino)methylideneamino]imidazole-4-carboxamide isomerase [Blautia sp.]MDD7370296.1 1-(5-phosphoribosyl)-5-[(5-phosphoribosylamino)methylideneamino]imidazole-4-carboxamide isomerase [Bacillota bacterium]MDY3715095.1 1-(5-phosphoribosyl)-5-[(5-phosphoribosylamino)methylideneamino]imidazole-4-carboxamide isomerase [Blautia sp.]